MVATGLGLSILLTSLPVSSLLGSETCLSTLSVTVVTPPQGVELTEVHVGGHSARLIRLSRLAASLAEEAAVPGAGAGALGLRVGRLQGGCGALVTGNTGDKQRALVVRKRKQQQQQEEELRLPMRDALVVHRDTLDKPSVVVEKEEEQFNLSSLVEIQP